MEISPYLLFLLALYSLMFGFAWGSVCDGFRLFRWLMGEKTPSNRWEALYDRTIPFFHRKLACPGANAKFIDLLLKAITLIADLLLFCGAAVGLAILCYHFNEGRFRIYTVLTCAAGFFLYRLTIGRLVDWLSSALVFWMKAVLTVIFCLFLRPFVIFARIFGKNLKKIYINFMFSLAKLQKILYNRNSKKALLKKAQKGFLESTSLFPYEME